MSNSDYRIPDDMAAEVLAEAARLYAQASKGYSFEDLQQACSEAQIPSHIIRQALRNVEEKRSRDLTKRRQEQEYIKQQVRRGVSIGIALLIPAITVSSIFIFRSQFKPVVSKLLSPFKPDQQQSNASVKTLTVKNGTLKYLTDSKGLSISVAQTSSSNSSVQATIGTDGYKSLYIFTDSDCEIGAIRNRLSESDENRNCQIGKLGESYDYNSIYNYRIKIVSVSYDEATFQIEQQGQQPQSPVKRLGEEVKQLQQQRQEHQSQIKKLQNEQNDLKQKLQQRDEEIKWLEQENNRLESQRSSNQTSVLNNSSSQKP